MATMTIRLPDHTYDRLKQLARKRGLSLNKLMEQLSTSALAEFDVETRFLLRAQRGSIERGLAILDGIDQKTSSGR